MTKVYVNKIDEMSNRTTHKTTISGKDILIINAGNNFYAIDDVCTHAGASLSEGKLSDTTIICDWHGAKFNYRNGKLEEFISKIKDLKSYKVIVESGSIFIEL